MVNINISQRIIITLPSSPIQLDSCVKPLQRAVSNFHRWHRRQRHWCYWLCILRLRTSFWKLGAKGIWRPKWIWRIIKFSNDEQALASLCLIVFIAETTLWGRWWKMTSLRAPRDRARDLRDSPRCATKLISSSVHNTFHYSGAAVVLFVFTSDCWTDTTNFKNCGG